MCTHTAQPARTGAPRRTHRTVSWRPPASCSGREPGRVAGLHGRIAGAPTPYRGLPRDTMPNRLAHLVTIHPIVLRYNPQLPALAGHNTIHPIAIEYPLLQPLLVTIQSVYCHPMPLSRLLYCSTNVNPLQYNFSSQPALSCNTLPLLQYNFIGR